VNLTFEYINYLWNAKKRHGIHSPFIYALADQCLRIQIEPSWSRDLQEIEQKMRDDSTTLTIADYGAGSKKMGKERKISDLYKTSSTKGKYGKLLFRLARHFQFQNMLELGTSIGIGSLQLHHGNPSGNLTTVEACSQTQGFAQGLFHKYAQNQITSNLNTFTNYLRLYKGDPFDFIYIDGHHDGTALLEYVELLRPHILPSTVFLVDDIRWSEDMLNSWKKLKEYPEFHVSIDFFRMGMLVSRPEQEKEHFILRLPSS
jgi:predicted O-methyltransferase YrrM